MVNTMKLKGKMKECNFTQASLSKELGITQRTMGIRLKSGIFKTDEIDKIILALHLTQDEAINIFFAQKVS